MSDLLESDNHEKRPDVFDESDKLCVLPPGKKNLVADEFYLENHSKYSLFYYVQLIPPDALSKPPTPERIVIHLVPKSRKDELVPS